MLSDIFQKVAQALPIAAVAYSQEHHQHQEAANASLLGSASFPISYPA